MRDDEIEPLEGNTRGLTGEHYAPQRIADEMLEFVRENQDKPFFLYYPSVIPHLPLQAPERFVEEYEGQWPETPYDGDRYLLNPTPKACYAGMISFLDHQVGRLIDTLKELGLEDDTLIIFTSDNGTTHLDQQVDHEFFNSVGPLRGLKGSLYEGGIRVPLVAKWPGHIPANTTADHVAANYDVLATLADLVGEDPPKGTDGVSFLPALLGQDDKQAAHDHLYWDFPGYGGQIAVRVGRWKAIKTGLQDDPDAPLELYNLAEDPGESNNVAEEQPEIAKEMEQIMLEGRTKPEYERFRFGTYVE